ncbi:cob(I)yrinic acid a,c-diamide adenosyltransferase [Thermomonospora catenispora]|uniref:cob(I)yrinic acid a,c-diamide adenosyltransferase n=1 Tax=Thermomonospora catenispora TaxID=2493090 RepID=UPI00111E6394|nr:cob(I)yrinic acid a,c-diamide adenosyltransferase [Thermomonospora catenispora]TNY37008.1 cob(I)yrinic acid a,c-diamide adenosyltransferase [Thermomonospora catenispora]
MPKNEETPVVLSRIYTRTGDDGTTALGDMSRTRKTDPRLAAYADVEEANAAIGVALALGSLPEELRALLVRVQNDLYDVGADLCTPMSDDSATGHRPLRVEESYITRLEEACDRYNAELKPLRSFILPGGAPGAALLHLARTVTRRAERSVWAAIEHHGAAPEGTVNPLTARYLNRLSDLLFILCRVANADHGDVLWRPGGER